MKPTTKKLDTLKRRYAKVGVDVTDWVQSIDGEFIATQFCCVECGTTFAPDAKRVRMRHYCPNGCNKGLRL
jgi:hypothetical protein